MKTSKFLPLVFVSFILSASSFAAEIKERVTVPYWAPGIASGHAAVAEEYLNKTLKTYDCLQGELESTVLKKTKTHIFTHDEPGTMQLTYSTKCFSDDLKDFKFLFNLGGYDEDYSELILRITTRKHGAIDTRICIYGGDDRLTKCPSIIPVGTDFSETVDGK